VKTEVPLSRFSVPFHENVPILKRSSTSIEVCCFQISVLEVLGGADFSNIWQGPAPLAISLVMLLVDIFLYFVLTVYLDQVVPGNVQTAYLSNEGS